MDGEVLFMTFFNGIISLFVCPRMNMDCVEGLNGQNCFKDICGNLIYISQFLQMAAVSGDTTVHKNLNANYNWSVNFQGFFSNLIQS